MHTRRKLTNFVLTVIEKYIKDAQQNGQSPSLKAFVEAQREYVIKHSKVGEDTSAVWGNRIIKVAKRLQVQLVNSKHMLYRMLHL